MFSLIRREVIYSKVLYFRGMREVKDRQSNLYSIILFYMFICFNNTNNVLVKRNLEIFLVQDSHFTDENSARLSNLMRK